MILTTGVIPPPPTRRQRTRRMIQHFENMLGFLGERLAVAQFRKRMVWYSKTIGPCPQLRRKIPYIHTATEFFDLVGRFLDELDEVEVGGGKSEATVGRLVADEISSAGASPSLPRARPDEMVSL